MLMPQSKSELSREGPTRSQGLAGGRLEGRVEARIIVEGTGPDFESLCDWLHHEPELRGRVRTAVGPVPDGALGVSTELVVALVTSGSGTVAVLARAVSRWLIERERQRHSDVTVKVTTPDGGQVAVSVRRAAESEQILRTALEAAMPGLLPSSDQPGTSQGE